MFVFPQEILHSLTKLLRFFVSEHKVSQRVQNICKGIQGFEGNTGFVSEHKVCWQNANICEKKQIPLPCPFRAGVSNLAPGWPLSCRILETSR